MNPRLKYLTGSALVFSLAAGAIAFFDDAAMDTADTTATSLAGISASVRFTDDHGNERMPTEADRAALADAFQADIAKLMRGRKIPVGSKKQPNGSVSAVVGTDKMRFLTIELDEEGNASFRHADIADQGRVEPASVQDWPEM